MWLFRAKDVVSEVVEYCKRKAYWQGTFQLRTHVVDTLLLRHVDETTVEKLDKALGDAGFDMQVVHNDTLLGTTVRITC